MRAVGPAVNDDSGGVCADEVMVIVFKVFHRVFLLSPSSLVDWRASFSAQIGIENKRRYTIKMICYKINIASNKISIRRR